MISSLKIFRFGRFGLRSGDRPDIFLPFLKPGHVPV